MRVLVATDQWFPDVNAGPARLAAEGARELCRRGHEVTVLAPRKRGKASVQVDGGLTVRRVLARSALPQTLTDPIETWRHARAAGPSGFDVLLAHQSTTAAGLVAAQPGVPLVLVYHASAVRELRFLRSRLGFGPQRLATYALEPPLRLLERRAVRRAARILVLSEFSRGLLATDHPGGAGRARLVPGGVDVDRFSPRDGMTAARARLGVAPETILLLTVRRLEPRMGLDRLLHAVTRLRVRGDLILAVAGEGSLRARLERLAGDLGLNKRVRFLGRVSDEELPDWYRAADLFVLPTVAYEGFGMVTAEALACGTPVVGTPVGATPELLAPLDPGLVARSAEPQALAAAIEEALSTAGDALRRRCREYASARFSWENAVTGWEEALLDVAAPPSTSDGRVELLGAPLDPVSLREAADLVEERIRTREPFLHASVNAAKLVRLQRDVELAEAVRACDLVTADGQPVVWAARALGRPLPERVAGVDLMEAVLERADRSSYRVYLLGGRGDVLADAEEEIRRRFPGVQIAGSHHGYFRPEEEPAVVAQIAAVEPDILFVALGTPQKELFQTRHREALRVPFAMGVGGALEVLAGRRVRAPRWAQAGGLEWLFRLLQEPRRLLRRYLVGNARFVALVVKELVRTRLGQSPPPRTSR